MKVHYQIIRNLLFSQDELVNSIQRLNNKKSNLLPTEVLNILSDASNYNLYLTKEVVLEAISKQGFLAQKEMNHLPLEIQRKKIDHINESKIIKDLDLIDNLKFNNINENLRHDTSHKFKALVDRFNLLDKNNSFLEEQYFFTFIFLNFISEYLEKNNFIDLNPLYAYKILVCFSERVLNDVDSNLLSTIDNSIRFLTLNFIPKSDTPLFDLLSQFELPEKGSNVSLRVWRNFITKYNVKALKLLGVADLIEEKKSELNGEKDGHIAPKDLDEALKLKLCIKYKRAIEHIEMARLFDQYSVPETVFNYSLNIELGKNIFKKKKKDNLPNIIVNGKNINHIKTPGYFLVKLPHNDMRSYILGYITNCCQSIGGNSEKCVIDGITKENNGFFVLLKGNKNFDSPFYETGEINYSKYKIVGQGYAWLTRAGNLTFDSWENLRNQQDQELNDDAIIVAMLEAFTEEVLKEKTILRVTIGRGGKTPNFYKKSTIIYPESILDGFQYIDSKEQALIKQNIDLTRIQNDLASKLPKHHKQILSFKQAETIKTIELELKNFNTSLLEMFRDKEKLLDYIINYECLKKTSISYQYLKNLLEIDNQLLPTLTSEAAQNFYFLFNKDIFVDIKAFDILINQYEKSIGLLNIGIDTETLIEMYNENFEKAILLIENSKNIEKLSQYNLDIATLIEMYDTNPNKAILFIRNGCNIERLDQSNLDITKLIEMYDTNPNKAIFFIYNTDNIEKLAKCHFSSESLIQMYEINSEFTQLFIENSETLEMLYLTGIKLKDFVKIYNTQELLNLFDNSAYRLKKIGRFCIEYCDFFEKLLDLEINLELIVKIYDENPEKAMFFINNVETLEKLISFNLTPKTLIEMYDKNPENTKLMILKKNNLIELLENNFDINDILILNNNEFELTKFVINNSNEITKIIKERKISIKKIISCNEKKQIEGLLSEDIIPNVFSELIHIKQIIDHNPINQAKTCTNSDINPIIKESFATKVRRSASSNINPIIKESFATKVRRSASDNSIRK